VPLQLITGPPNSGRAGRIRRLFSGSLDREPLLVVPTLDDVTAFQRELSGEGAVLGGAVTTFEGLTRAIAAAGGMPRPALTSSQRLLVISAAIAERRRALGPMGRSAAYPGFARALTVLLDDLQAGGLSPDDVLAGARTLGDNAYLGDLAAIFSSYIEIRDRLGRTDAHGIAADAIAVLRGEREDWPARPVFLYGFDDLAPAQRDLVEALAARGEVTITIPHEDGNEVLRARARLFDALRGQGTEMEALEADAGNTGSATLFELERSFSGVREARLAEDGAEGLTLLRSAGARAEAEAIAAHVARLIHDGAEEEEIAIVLRDPARRGPLLARVLESYGVAAALEARRPVAATGVGGTLLALLESEYGARRAGDTLRWLRGPSGASSSAADWTERSIRQSRARTAAEALELWSARYEELPYDLRKLRDAPAEEIAAELADIARRMASRFLAGDEDGPAPGPGDGTELRAAAAIANALTEIAELGGLAPGPAGLLTFLQELDFLAWSGPIEGRVRIAEPRKLRATRFEHVVIGSLQDGEFPHRRGGDPFLSEPQREKLGLDPRSDVDAEERYLFYSSLSRASRSLTLSYRDSDEDGSAEARSPYLDDVIRLLCPHGDADERDAAEKGLTMVRDLARITLPAGDAPSEDELARALAALPVAAVPAALAAAEPETATGARVEARLDAARVAERQTREPGPLANPAVLGELGRVPAYGGTTLETFDTCSYQWFVDHELSPQPLDPIPDPLLQGSLMHRVLYLLYKEGPSSDSRPRPATLAAWVARARELVPVVAAELGIGERAPERAIRRGVEGLLVRLLEEEARRSDGAFEPWLLEAGFGEGEDRERPPLEIDGWRLHGAIDRADRAADGRVVVHDYKVSSKATPAKKLVEDAKLQLQLYMLAISEQWGGTPIGGLYHPLRGTRERRPRGLLLKDAAADLAGYELVNTDLLEEAPFEEALEEARSRAGTIVARMRDGDIRRDPGPPEGKKHDVCPVFCDFAPICRRDRPPADAEEDREDES
jgi:RecB family exonuclease